MGINSDKKMQILLLLSALFHSLFTANCLGKWCPWSTPSCWRAFTGCRLYRHRMCACPEPLTGGAFCSNNEYATIKHGFSIPTSLPYSKNYKCMLATINKKRKYCNESDESTPPWCGWQPWSPWSTTCGKAISLRQRLCRCENKDRPKKLCNGKDWETESRKKTGKQCPTVPGWCEWSEWTEPCNCENARDKSSERVRECKCPVVKHSYCLGSPVKKCVKQSSCDQYYNTEDSEDSEGGANTVMYILLVIVVMIIAMCYRFYKWNQKKMARGIAERQAEARRAYEVSHSNQNESRLPEATRVITSSVLQQQPLMTTASSSNENETASTNNDPPAYSTAAAMPPPAPAQPSEEQQDALPPSYEAVMANTSEFSVTTK